jgi:hypothetical protein
MQKATDQSSFAIETLQFGRPANAANQLFQDYLLLFLSLVAAYCIWVFSLPLFPTQDDAMHLYYVDVIRHLLSGPSKFDAFYYLRHPMPPYLVHYAGLLLLTMFVKPVLAEKCMVCVILVSTAFGFRYLACGVGRNGGLMSLFIMPIALSWPLFMGFHNFCLALSFSLWAWGFWIRIIKKPSWFLRIAFLVAVLLILFTHPVPLLFLLAVISFDIALRVVHKVGGGSTWTSAVGIFKGDIALAVLAYFSLFYVALFVDKASATRDLMESGSRLQVAFGFIRLEYMSFATGGILTKLCRCGVALLLLYSVVLAFKQVKQSWKAGVVDNSAVMLCCAVALAVFIPLLPPNMNGSEHFSNRLSILVWITALAGASERWIAANYRRRATVIAACLFAVFNLIVANHVIRPVATDISEIESITANHKQAGLVFDSPSQIGIGRLTFGPYLRWVGARYFRRAGAILINDPWSSPPYPLPLRRSRNSIIEEFTRKELQDPVILHRHLLDSAAFRERLLSSVDLIVFVGNHDPATSVPDPLIAVDGTRQWKCRNATWYSVCEIEGDRVSNSE